MRSNKMKPGSPSPEAKPVWLPQSPVDYAAAALALVYIGLISIFPIRSNDVWWNMAVGRELLTSFHFITQDPFTFTVTGSSWVPHSFLSGIIFYLVYQAGAASGLIGLKVLLVLITFTLILRLIKNEGVPLAYAVPFILVGALSIHSRFLVRPHLFEYLFLVLLASWLMSRKERSGIRFYWPPALLQIIWVNCHSSFFIGPVIVLIFLLGESLRAWVGGSAPARRAALDKRRKQLLVLFFVMAAVSLVNPHPAMFILQPLGGEQRELITRYTLEWLSPFNAALKHGALHPYYEIYLVFAAVTILLGLVRRRFSAALLTGLFLLLSLKAHRFRAELVIISLPFLMTELKDTRFLTAWGEKISRKIGRPALRTGFALVFSAVLILTATDRFILKGGVGSRHPERAFEFIQKEDVAHRPFHPIGYGSFMLWRLYPERQSFIDGRNFSPALYQDFLACQTNVAGFHRVVQKYDIDSFLLPVPERSDAGITNLHTALDRFDKWALIYIDAVALVYVRTDAVSTEWLEKHQYHHYHPAFFGRDRISGDAIPALTAEIERAIAGDGESVQLWQDLARIKMVTGDRPGARRAVEKSLQLDPENAASKELLQQLQRP
jgi:hypothetical protein